MGDTNTLRVGPSADPIATQAQAFRDIVSLIRPADIKRVAEITCHVEKRGVEHVIGITDVRGVTVGYTERRTRHTCLYIQIHVNIKTYVFDRAPSDDRAKG